MRRLDVLGIVGTMIARAAVAAVAAVAASATAAGANEGGFRYRAPVTIEHAAPFVQMALPASAYAHSEHQLSDLRLVDARGERVPFALLVPREGVAQRIEQPHDAPLYALPPRPAASGADWPSPLDLTIDGNSIHVQRRSIGPPAGGTSPGWLIDLGARQPGDPAPELLRLAWPVAATGTSAAEFSSGFTIETSDDLRQWRAGGSGQVLALSAASAGWSSPTSCCPKASAASSASSGTTPLRRRR